MTSASGLRAAPEANPTDRGAAVIHEIARSASGATGLVGLATTSALPAALIAAIFTVQYLNPTQFGEYALLMVYATFLTVLYNVGLLHGTFLWVYGSSGEAGDDLEIEGLGRAEVNGQRRAMTTGLIMLLILATAGTVFFFIFKRPVAELLLGNAHAANLVGWAAISGACGSLYRLTCNVFRFERRQVAFSIATVMRPITVLAASIAFLAAGYGLWGAVMGTAVPTIACSVGCMLATRRSYALAASFADAKAIIARGAVVVIPVLALFVLHNGDIYVVSHFVHGSSLGVYRLASRMGSLPSYFASAFIMTWTPLERSALGTAAYEARGRLELRAGVLTYYVLAGLSLVVLFVLFGHLLVLVAPASYRKAASVIGLITLAYVVYGSYIVVLRTARPDRIIKWYTITAVIAALTFLLCAGVLIPAFGISGAPIAMTIGMAIGSGVLLLVNSRNSEPVPVEYKRIGAGFLVVGVIWALSIVGGRVGTALDPAVTILCLVGFVPALVLTGAVPRSHLSSIRQVLLKPSGHRRLEMTLDELPSAERDVLERFRLGTLQGSRSALEYARLVRGLRRLGGIGTPSPADVRVGLYLASPEPEAIRDFQATALIEDGVDAYELHSLDRLARAARRSRLPKARSNAQARSSLRTRARALGVPERASVAGALAAAGVAARSRPRTEPAAEAGSSSAANGHSPSLALVRALRSVRSSLGVGTASASDLLLARALWQGERAALSERERDELRRLKTAAKLSSRFADDPLEVRALETVT